MKRFNFGERKLIVKTVISLLMKIEVKILGNFNQ